MDNESRAIRIISMLRKSTQGMVVPASTSIIQKYGKDPYRILISCLLSLRTKDTVSLPASLRLFEQAKTPTQMLTLPLKHIEKLIYPCGFYRRKAALMHVVSQQLLDEFGGKVPSDEAQLLSLRGVGRKTAALVQGVAFGIPAICVDTHVHRVSNRLGLVNTQTTQETESALKKLLPEKYWLEITDLLIMHGQNVCVPISPFCSKCPVASLCPRKGVTRSR